MPKATMIQPSFTSGELAPRMYGRVDVERYFTGVKTMENFLLTPFGSAERVPGTYYVAPAKYAAKKCRLLNFTYSASTAYVIEFGEYYMRFYKSNGQLVVTSPSAWGTGTGYVVGNYVSQGGVIYYCIVAHTSGTFATDLAAAKWVAQDIYEVPTPYTEAQLPNVQYKTTGDIGYFTHPSHPTYKLSRFADTTWTFAAVSFKYPMFLPTNTVAANTMTPSATTGSITITSSVSYFTAAFVGTYVQMKHSTTTGYALITAYTNATTVTATVVVTFGATSATDNWNISVGAYAGYPQAVAFHDQRLMMAGATLSPSTIWGSAINDYENFSLSAAAASDAIRYTIASDTVNNIVWLESARELLVGTIGGCFVLSSGGSTTGLTPSNATVRRQNSYGSAVIQPKMIGNNVYYVTKNSKKTREMSYVFDSDAYRGPDITMLSEHIFGAGVTEMAYQQEPNNIMWFVRSDGELACLTREPEQEVIGWSRVKEDTHTTDLYESVAVVPSTNEDQVWISVKRKINGAFVRYIEYMMPLNFDTKSDAFFVRSGLTYSGVATLTITGLSHLEGETVSVLANGAVHPDCVVASGSITLQSTKTLVHVGLKYTSDIVGVNLEGGSGNGTAQTKKKRVNKVGIRFYKTLGAKVGIEGGTLDTKAFRNTSEPMDDSPALFSGDKIIPISGGSDREWNIEVKQEQPLPMTILAIIPYATTFD